MHNDQQDQDNTPALTKEQAYAATEITSLCEMWEHHEQGFHQEVIRLVRRLSNIFNPNEPTVDEDFLKQASLENGKDYEDE